MIEPGRKIEIADLTALASLASAKGLRGAPYRFVGRIHEVTVDIRPPITTARWLNVEHVKGLLVGDMVVSLFETAGVQPRYQLMRYPWNDPASWVPVTDIRVGLPFLRNEFRPNFGGLWWDRYPVGFPTVVRRERLWMYQRPGVWGRYTGWATELGRLLNDIATDERLNLLDGTRTSTFSGWRAEGLVSERHVLPTFPTDVMGQMPVGDFLTMEYPEEDNWQTGRVPTGTVVPGIGLRAKEIEVVHTVSGVRRDWDLVVVPPFDEVPAETQELRRVVWPGGFRLVSETPMEIRGRLSPYTDDPNALVGGAGGPPVQPGNVTGDWNFLILRPYSGEPTCSVSGTLAEFARVRVFKTQRFSGEAHDKWKVQVELRGTLPASPEGRDWTLDFSLQIPPGAEASPAPIPRPSQRLKMLFAGGFTFGGQTFPATLAYPVFLRARGVATSARDNRRGVKVSDGDVYASGVLPMAYCTRLSSSPSPEFVKSGTPVGVSAYAPASSDAQPTGIETGRWGRVIGKSFPIGQWRHEWIPNTGGRAQRPFALGYLDKFDIGDRVTCGRAVSVYETPDATVISTQAKGAAGTVSEGPTVTLTGEWWRIQFAVVHGWVREGLKFGEIDPVLSRVNTRGPDGGFVMGGSQTDSNQLAHTGKVWPCYKHPVSAEVYRELRLRDGSTVPGGILFGEIAEIIVARNSVLRGGVRRMPETGVDEETEEPVSAALQVRVGYYKASAIGTFNSLVTVIIEAGSNVGRWRAETGGGPIVAYEPWPLVYDCAEAVLVSVKYLEALSGDEWTVGVPVMAETVGNVERVLEGF